MVKVILEMATFRRFLGNPLRALKNHNFKLPPPQHNFSTPPSGGGLLKLRRSPKPGVATKVF